MNQAEFIYHFNDQHRQKFNERFFYKSDDDIIEDLKDMILSCQRSKFYTLRVDGFEVIEDYATVQELLTGQDTPTISIKDSDLKILKVKYYAKTAIQDPVDPTRGEDTFEVLIAVPRVIDHAYIHLNGNDYFPIFQLVDGSTYNNTTSQSAKTQSITLKTNSNAIKMFRNFNDYKTTEGDVKRLSMFSLYLFDHKISIYEYYLARFGWIDTLCKFKFDQVIQIGDYDPGDDFLYTFEAKASAMPGSIFISAPKFIVDEDRMIQSFIATIINTVTKHGNRKMKVDTFYTTDFWITKLGHNFIKSEASAYAKGIAIVESLENSYDISTRKRLRLPDVIKQDIYTIIKWMACEFSHIRLRDNLDASTKRIRWSEYIAAMYIMLINQKMRRRLPDKANNTLEVGRIKQVITTAPMALISELQKSSLKGFRNMVNDRDSFLQLKYTIKGPSGPGESNNKNIARAIRAVHPSQIGIIDLNTSSASDPGVGGLLCPLNQDIYEWDSFTNEAEPVTWDDKFNYLLEEYRRKKSLKAVFTLIEDSGLNTVNQEEVAQAEHEAVDISKEIAAVHTIRQFEKQIDNMERVTTIPMEGSGSIIFQEGGNQ